MRQPSSGVRLWHRSQRYLRRSAVRVLRSLSLVPMALMCSASMVRVLREDEGADYSPQLGVANLPGLARDDAIPTVEVSLGGSLSQLPPAVDAALYRLAQESLTNALRHARGATRVVIHVRRDGNAVRLRVTDNGQAATPSEPGFGLLGMTERAQLLGGSLTAGPGPDGGWVVEAILPA